MPSALIRKDDPAYTQSFTQTSVGLSTMVFTYFNMVTHTGFHQLRQSYTHTTFWEYRYNYTYWFSQTSILGFTNCSQVVHTHFFQTSVGLYTIVYTNFGRVIHGFHKLWYGYKQSILRTLVGLHTKPYQKIVKTALSKCQWHNVSLKMLASLWLASLELLLACHLLQVTNKIGFFTFHV